MITRDLLELLLSHLNRLPAICAALSCFLSLQLADAHPELMNFVRHRVSVSVGSNNVDVSVELTIGENPSFVERLSMDTNQNGRVEESEIEEYLSELSEMLLQALSISIGGQPTELFFLYEPEVDLGNENTLSPSHLVIRLFYFAKTPSGIKAGDEIVIEDRLWPHAPALGAYQLDGQDGIELVAEKTESVLWSPARDKRPLVMRARFHAIPDNVSGEEQSGNLPQPAPSAEVIKVKVAVDDLKVAQSVEHDRAEKMKTAGSAQGLQIANTLTGWLFAVAMLAAGSILVLYCRVHRSREETFI